MKAIIATVKLIVSEEAYQDLVDEATEEGYQDPLSYLSHLFYVEFTNDGVVVESALVELGNITITT